MPRYFFHVHDGDDFIDLQGTVLPDLQAARREAARFSGALLVEHGDKFWSDSEWKMRVTDDADLTLFELSFLATEAASIAGTRARQ